MGTKGVVCAESAALTVLKFLMNSPRGSSLIATSIPPLSGVPWARKTVPKDPCPSMLICTRRNDAKSSDNCKSTSKQSCECPACFPLDKKLN